VSIPVEIADLERAMTEHDTAYLLSNLDGRTHVVTVDPRVVDEVLVVDEPGRRTSANLSANACCTLVFPPREPHGYTLLVDGVATLTGAGLEIRPDTAVLHRPASQADGPSGSGDAAECVNDCRAVG
jgi:hypothetical protein